MLRLKEHGMPGFYAGPRTKTETGPPHRVAILTERSTAVERLPTFCVGTYRTCLCGYDVETKTGKKSMKASVLCFRAAVLMVVCGIIWGIAMGISHDHSTFPAHAHLNLLGWVSLFLFGIYYHLHPAIDDNRLASLQVWIWIAATVVLSIRVALVHLGRPAAESAAAIASLVILADMLLFGWLVFRREKKQLAHQPSAAPAD